MKHFIIVLFFMSAMMQAQVGIGTTSPNATLDVTGNAAGASLDGIKIPSITGNALAAATYNGLHIGDFLYVTSRPSPTPAQCYNITQPAPYFFDGTRWRQLADQYGGTVLGVGNIGGPNIASMSVNGSLVSASKAYVNNQINDITITHNLNLTGASYFVSITVMSNAGTGNYAQFDLDNGTIDYTPLIHDITANSFKVYLEDFSDTNQDIRLIIDISTGSER